MVELVYKFDNNSTTSFYKGESTAKMLFKLIWGHIHINKYIYIYKNIHWSRLRNRTCGIIINYFVAVLFLSFFCLQDITSFGVLVS